MIDFKNKPIFGMIHLAGNDSLKHSRALEEAEIMLSEGVDGIVVENYHGSIEDVRTALFHLMKDYKGLLGINVLPNEYELAFELAEEFNADFIQLDFVAGTYDMFRSHRFIFEEHYEGVRNKARLARKEANQEDIIVLGGVWPKYYHPVKNSILKDDIEMGMKRAEAIVVTGEGTGKQTPIKKIQEFKTIMGEHPLVVGAGLTPETVAQQLAIADGAIVGSAFKPHGITTQKIERSLVKEFMDEVKKLR